MIVRVLQSWFMKHILLQHQLKVITSANEEDMQPVHVHVCICSFNVSKTLKVRFISEQAQNEGGPRSLLFWWKPALQHPLLFCGWPDHVIAMHNSAVAENKYYLILLLPVRTPSLLLSFCCQLHCLQLFVPNLQLMTYPTMMCVKPWKRYMYLLMYMYMFVFTCMCIIQGSAYYRWVFSIWLMSVDSRTIL